MARMKKRLDGEPGKSLEFCQPKIRIRGDDMGKRKMVKGEGREINVWVGVETVRELDRLGERLNMTRSRLARNLLESGLEDAKLMDLFGLLALMHKVESIQTQWRERGENGGVDSQVVSPA